MKVLLLCLLLVAPSILAGRDNKKKNGHDSPKGGAADEQCRTPKEVVYKLRDNVRDVQKRLGTINGHLKKCKTNKDLKKHDQDIQKDLAKLFEKLHESNCACKAIKSNVDQKENHKLYKQVTTISAHITIQLELVTRLTIHLGKESLKDLKKVVAQLERSVDKLVRELERIIEALLKFVAKLTIIVVCYAQNIARTGSELIQSTLREASHLGEDVKREAIGACGATGKEIKDYLYTAEGTATLLLNSGRKDIDEKTAENLKLVVKTSRDTIVKCSGLTNAAKNIDGRDVNNVIADLTVRNNDILKGLLRLDELVRVLVRLIGGLVKVVVKVVDDVVGGVGRITIL